VYVCVFFPERPTSTPRPKKKRMVVPKNVQFRSQASLNFRTYHSNLRRISGLQVLFNLFCRGMFFWSEGYIIENQDLKITLFHETQFDSVCFNKDKSLLSL